MVRYGGGCSMLRVAVAVTTRAYRSRNHHAIEPTDQAPIDTFLVAMDTRAEYNRVALRGFWETCNNYMSHYMPHCTHTSGLHPPHPPASMPCMHMRSWADK